MEKLSSLYDDFENEAWIAIPDSKEGSIVANAVGSSGGNPGNGWKIHISIDPNKIAEAVLFIAERLNIDNSPRVSIKFANQLLAANGQPSKQIAFIFYNEELHNKAKITAFLEEIDLLLTVNHIGPDPRPINSNLEDTKTKYDAMLLDSKGNPTRFNYRNEQCIVMEDALYSEVGGTENTCVQSEQIWVKQSYYAILANSEKHNPGNCVVDPLEGIQIQLYGRPVLSTDRNRMLSLSFFKVLNPTIKDTGFIHPAFDKETFTFTIPTEVIDDTVCENISKRFKANNSYLQDMADVYSVLVGTHYPIESPFYQIPFIGDPSAKGILDFLIFPLVARALIECPESTITKIFGLLIALPLEIARFSLGIALTVFLAPIVALIDLLKVCLPNSNEENTFSAHTLRT